MDASIMSAEWHLPSAKFAGRPFAAAGAAKPVAFNPPRMAGIDRANRRIGR
jgi:hypothetical protein